MWQMSGENGLAKAMTGTRVSQHEALSSSPKAHVSKKKKKKVRQCTFAASALLSLGARELEASASPGLTGQSA